MAQTRFIFNTHIEYHMVKEAKGIMKKYKRVKVIDNEKAEYKQI